MEQVGPSEFARWSDAITPALLTVVQAQHQHPVLVYFFWPDQSRALPVQVGKLLDVRSQLEQRRDSAVFETLASHPSLLAMDSAVTKYLHEIDAYFIPDGCSAPQKGRSECDLREVQSRVLSYLGYSPSEAGAGG